MTLVRGRPDSKQRREWDAVAARQAAHRRAKLEKEQADRARYIAELEAEIDQEDREAAEPRPVRDPVDVLRSQIDTEAKNRAAMQSGDFPKLKKGSIIRRIDKDRMRAERTAREREEREAELGLPAEQRACDERRQEINDEQAAGLAEAQ